MTSTSMKVYYMPESSLSNLPVDNGQMIFAFDTQTVYLDMKGVRRPYNTIKVFETDADRIYGLAPSTGFYFVEETNVLWRYKNGWKQLTSKNNEQVQFFDNLESLPEEGEENALYCTQDAIYMWRNQSYHMIANKSMWGSL